MRSLVRCALAAFISSALAQSALADPRCVDDALAEGAVYYPTAELTTCLNKADFDKIIALERQGQNAQPLFDSISTCQTLTIHAMILRKKLDEFTMPGGEHYWYLEAQDPGDSRLYYVAMPVEKAKSCSPEE